MRKIWMILLLTLTLAGCKTVMEIKPDTIVDIPLHPTQAQTEAATDPTETEPQPTETAPAAEVTEPTEAPARTSGGKTSSGKTGGGKSTGKTNSGSSKPPATEAPTQPPTEAPTQAPTAPPTEPPTEAPTELPAYDPAGYDPSGYAPGSLDWAVTEAVNARRQEAGLEELTFDTRLCAIASVRAYELSLDWSQSRPDGSGGLTVLGQYGYGYTWAAQNLYNGGGSGEKIVSKWMSAASASANILSESAAAIGVGTYTADTGVTYVAAIFAG